MLFVIKRSETGSLAMSEKMRKRGEEEEEGEGEGRGGKRTEKNLHKLVRKGSPPDRHVFAESLDGVGSLNEPPPTPEILR